MRMRATIASSIAITAYLLFTSFPVSAQSDEERNFLLMYFKEEDLVVESATRSPKPVSQTAENITVVTAGDMELMNAHTVAEVLNTVTGVEFWMYGGPGQTANAYIQGAESRYTTVVIDGVILNNISLTRVDLGSMPVQNIERIEIIKGPASSTWGSALGGVVNIITKSGEADNAGALFSAAYGKKGSNDLRAEARGKQGGLGYYLFAGRLQSDGLTPLFDIAEDTGYLKLSYDLAHDTVVLLAAGSNDTSRGTGTDPPPPTTSYRNLLSVLHATLEIRTSLTRELDLNISLRTIRQNYIDSLYDFNTGAFNGEQRFLDKGRGSSAKLTWKGMSQTIVLGVDYDDKTLESNMMAGGEQTLRTRAIFMNDTIMFDRLSVTPGVRCDHTNTKGSINSPSIGLAYSVSNNTTLRGYAAKGFSIPALWELYNNPDLRVETTRSYQVGAETAAMKVVWMKVSIFRNDLRDAIDTTPTNLEPQRRQGGNIEIRTAPVYNTSFSAGAEYVDAKHLDSGVRVQNVPTHVYDLGIRYDDQRSLKAILKGRHIDLNMNPIYLASYSSYVFDLSMSKKIIQRPDMSVDAFMNLHNISNAKQYYAGSFKNPGRWLEGGVRFVF